MNIVILTPAWPQHDKPNGIVTYYSNLVPALRELGHRVFILTFDQKSSEGNDIHKISYRLSVLEEVWCNLVGRVVKGYKPYYLGSRSIVSSVRSILHQIGDIDVMQMEDSFGWHYFVQRKCLFPVVMRLHGPYLLVNQEECLSLKNKFRMKREQRAFQAARYVTSPSNDVLKKIERNYGQHWLLSRTIVNSISPEPRHRCWNLEEAEKHQILFVGRFDKTKGADVLLEAFFKVSAIYPAAKLFFIGPDIGIIKNGKKYNIEEYLEINNHSNGKVIYLGKQDQDTILKYRKSSHLTVVSSRYETFGNVVLEAFAIGSPLVCSDVGGLPEIVNDEVSGLIFESQNTQDLSNKILSLFRNDQLCKSIAQGGYLRVLDAYSPIVVAKELVEFFDQSVALQSDLDVRR